MAKLLMIDALYPDPRFGAGFPRAAQILQYLAQQDDLAIHFLALWQGGSGNQSQAASFLPHNVSTTSNLTARNLKRVLAKELKSTKAIWVSRFPIFRQIMQLRDREPALFSDVKIFYDSECIEALRSKRQAELAGNPINLDELNQALDEEMRLSRQANHVIAVSREEQEVFQSYGCKSVYVIAHKVKVVKQLKSPEGRAGILFVGRMEDEGSPNLDSIDWFATNCYPNLFQDGIRVKIVGSILDSLAKNLTQRGFEVTGQVADLQPLFDEARVFIAPTRFASGIPIKILDAAAAGLPVLATRILCNQLGWEADKDLLVADTPEEFLRKIRLVLEDDQLWSSLQKRASDRVHRDYSELAFERSFNPVLGLLRERLSP